MLKNCRFLNFLTYLTAKWQQSDTYPSLSQLLRYHRHHSGCCCCCCCFLSYFISFSRHFASSFISCVNILWHIRLVFCCSCCFCGLSTISTRYHCSSWALCATDTLGTVGDSLSLFSLSLCLSIISSLFTLWFLCACHNPF